MPERQGGVPGVRLLGEAGAACHSFPFCLFLAAAEMRGLIRVTNDGGACDLQESFGCNYMGHQVKESLLD